MLIYTNPIRAELPVSCLFVALMALLVADVARGQSNEQSAANSSSAANPYWRRPGCYRVGHTRTISIPGCVKFNLSTNACRGYCMSYSIPASEDLAGSSQILQESSFTLPGSIEVAQQQQQQQQSVEDTTKSPDVSLAAQLTSGRISHQQQQQQLMRLNQGVGAGQLYSQLEQQQGERRDVVSVSQCCNMMETEDVVVNLRCGANEIRRLVFKSAKTCECFFCKHV